MPRILPAAIATLTFAAGLTLPGAATAQDAGGERVNQVIVYGDDPCPASQGDEITVCARKPESERFRIPEPLRGVGRPESDAWSNRVLAYETVSKFGTDSCTPVGSGGFTGCTQRLIQRAAAERANGTDVRFGELIQQEREKRLATIDATAAQQQAMVETEEQAYEQRQQQQAAQPAQTGTAPAAATPAP